MRIYRQVVKFDGSESKRPKFVHQPPMTEMPYVVHDWTRKQKHLARMLRGDFLQKRSPLLQGQIVDALDGYDDIVAIERGLQKISTLKSGIWQVQRFRAGNRHIAYVNTDYRSCFAKHCLGQMAFATT